MGLCTGSAFESILSRSHAPQGSMVSDGVWLRCSLPLLGAIIQLLIWTLFLRTTDECVCSSPDGWLPALYSQQSSSLRDAQAACASYAEQEVPSTSSRKKK